MCGRTSLFVPPSVVEERFDATFDWDVVPRYNIAPRQRLAAITNEAPSTIAGLEWGLLPAFVDDPDDAPRPINARAETLGEKSYFREALERRRCLVVADGFYEWRGERGSKQPYRIQRTDDQPFAFAGLWERWEPSGDGDDPDAPRRTVTIVTTDANDLLAPIHDRMPAILAAEAEAAWLAAAERDLLDPADAEPLTAFPVSTAVNDPANDSAAVIEPAETEQSGFEDFTD